MLVRYVDYRALNKVSQVIAEHHQFLILPLVHECICAYGLLRVVPGTPVLSFRVLKMHKIHKHRFGPQSHFNQECPFVLCTTNCSETTGVVSYTAGVREWTTAWASTLVIRLCVIYRYLSHMPSSLEIISIF